MIAYKESSHKERNICKNKFRGVGLVGRPLYPIYVGDELFYNKCII